MPQVPILSLFLSETNSSAESLDDRVAEILEGAREMSVLCVFGLNRKKLGAALGFKLRMSVVGLSYIDGKDCLRRLQLLTCVAGANELYNDLVECAVKSRILFALQRKVLERQAEVRGTELIVPKFEATGHRDEGKDNTRLDLDVNQQYRHSKIEEQNPVYDGKVQKWREAAWLSKVHHRQAGRSVTRRTIEAKEQLDSVRARPW